MERYKNFVVKVLYNCKLQDKSGRILLNRTLSVRETIEMNPVAEQTAFVYRIPIKSDAITYKL
jgi:hypothetical protein